MRNSIIPIFQNAGIRAPTIQEIYELKMETLEKHRCQTCLDKFLESLEFRKWKHKRKRRFRFTWWILKLFPDHIPCYTHAPRYR